MYYLSQKDVKTLNETIKTVRNLPVKQRQGKSANTRGTFLYAIITGTAETTGFYYAQEIRFLSDGSTETVTNGVTWSDSTGLQLFVVGDVSVGTTLRVEPFYMYDSDSAQNVDIWVGSAVGSGGDAGVPTRLKVKEEFTLSYGSATLGNILDIVDIEDNVIQEGVTAFQVKFATATFYEDEILYARLSDENGFYDLSPYICGIGGDV